MDLVEGGTTGGGRKERELAWRAWIAGLLAVGCLVIVTPADAQSTFNTPGNILITDQFNYRVIEIDPPGNIVWQFGNGPGDTPTRSRRFGGTPEERKKIRLEAKIKVLLSSLMVFELLQVPGQDLRCITTLGNHFKFGYE